MFEPTPIGGFNCFVVFGKCFGSTFFDCFSKSCVGVVGNISYKVNSSFLDWKNLVIPLYV